MKTEEMEADGGDRDWESEYRTIQQEYEYEIGVPQIEIQQLKKKQNA